HAHRSSSNAFGDLQARCRRQQLEPHPPQAEVSNVSPGPTDVPSPCSGAVRSLLLNPSHLVARRTDPSQACFSITNSVPNVPTRSRKRISSCPLRSNSRRQLDQTELGKRNPRLRILQCSARWPGGRTRGGAGPRATRGGSGRVNGYRSVRKGRER